jgi:hypothetical protein
MQLVGARATVQQVVAAVAEEHVVAVLA